MKGWTLVLFLPVLACGDGTGPSAGGDLPGDGTTAADPGGDAVGPAAGGIPYVLDPAPTDASVRALLASARAAAEKDVPQALKDAVAQHAASQGLAIGAAQGALGDGDAGTGLAFEPDDVADLLRMLGYEALFRGNIGVSKWLFLWAAELKPGDPLVLNDAAFALIKAGDSASGKTVALRGLALDPSMHSLYVNLARACRDSGEDAKALLAILKAIGLQPRVKTYRQVAAEVMLETGDADGAYRQLEAALRLDPADEGIRSQLEEMDEPPEEEPQVPTPTSLGTAVKVLQCQNDAAMEYGAKVMGPGGKEMDADRVFLDEESLHSDQAIQCGNACGGGEGCWAQCAAAQCAADRASLAKAFLAEKPLPAEHEAVSLQMFDFFMGCATPVLAAEADPKALAEAIGLVDAYWDQVNWGIRAFHADATELMSIWHGSVAYTCEQANQAVEDAKLEAAYASVDNKAVLDLCLDKALCIGINNSAVSLSASVGIFNGKVSSDLATGAWSLSVGVGASDPTGTFQAGLSVKFHSTKGVGVGGDVKIGGPVKVRAGVDFYASEAL